MKAPLTAVFCIVVVSTAFADSQNFDLIERGRYLAVLSDCSACHTKPGGKPFAGGLALQSLSTAR